MVNSLARLQNLRETYDIALKAAEEFVPSLASNPRSLAMSEFIQEVRKTLPDQKEYARTRAQSRKIESYLQSLRASAQNRLAAPAPKSRVILPVPAPLIGLMGSYLPANELKAMQKMAQLAATTLDNSTHIIASVGKEMDLLKLAIGQWLQKTPDQPFVFPLLENRTTLADLTSLKPLFRTASREQLHILVEQLIKGCPNITHLDFSSCRLQDKTMALLASACTLQHLDLSFCPLTAAGLQHLSSLTALRQLNLFGVDITSDGLQCLSSLTVMQHLVLAHNNIRDIGLQHLAPLTALRHLDLKHCNNITSAGLQHLLPFTALQHLELQCSFHDMNAGFPHLSRLTSLQHLVLWGCHLIHDESLQHLSPLRNLQYLELGGGAALTDDGLQHLVPLTALKQLELWGCRRITEVGLRRYPHLAAVATLGQEKYIR